MLSLAWQSKSWNVLPNPGGLLDQPAGMVRRMTVLNNVYEAVKAFRAARNVAEWCDQYPDAWNLVQHVLKLRKLLHADK